MPCSEPCGNAHTEQMDDQRRAETTLSELLTDEVIRVAPRLLGATLTHAGVQVRITEVEAYAGAEDPASHAHRGPTARNAGMFGPSGRLYVYFTYGMHHCANVVTGPEGHPAAVLLRAGEVVDGLEIARRRRGSAVTDRDLARGPARLCQALALDLSHNGSDLVEGASPRLELPGHPDLLDPDAPRIESGPRVGVTLAADRPWRFWLADDKFVSAYRPAKPRSGLGGGPPTSL